MSDTPPSGSLFDGLRRLGSRCARQGRALLRRTPAPVRFQRGSRGDIWRGMTVEQLRAALGDPEAVERKVLGDRIQMTWKYLPVGLMDYRLQVIIEGEHVVSFEDRR